MKQFFGSVFLVGVVTMAASGCSGGGSSDSPSAAVAAAGAAKVMTVIADKVGQADLAQYSATFMEAKRKPTSIGVLSTPGDLSSTEWLDDTLVSNLKCGGSGCGSGVSAQSSLQTFVDNMLDKDFTNYDPSGEGASVGLMGRFYNAIYFSCAISQILAMKTGATDALPTPGTFTLTITAADLTSANSVCGSNLSLHSGETSFESTVVVTDVSAINGGLFDINIALTTPDGESESLLVKKSATYLRVLDSQVYPHDGYQHLSRYYATYDLSNGVVRFEGISRGLVDTDGQMGGYYFYRVYMDDTTKDVSLLGQNGGTSFASGSLSNSGRILMAGLANIDVPNATLGFSVSDGPTYGVENQRACINMSTGAHVSNGVCSGHTLDLTAAEALINTDIFALDTIGDWTFDETISDLSFTGSTIFTAQPAN